MPASQDWEAWNKAYEKFTKPTKCEYDLEKLQQACDWAVDLFSGMSDSRLVPFEEMYNNPGDWFDLKSSAGVTSKYQKKAQVVNDIAEYDKVFNSGSQILSGARSFCEAKMKDEIRDRERVSQKKTRIFISSTMEHMIAGTHLFGEQNYKLYNDWKATPSAAGMNVYSDWHDLVNSFLVREKKGFKTYSADASAFDSTIPSELLFCAAWVRCQLHADKNDPSFIDKVMKFYDHVVFDAIVTRRGLFWPNGKQKSGFINTYSDNCLINVILWYYSYSIAYPDMDLSELYMKVGGDDVIISSMYDPRKAADVMLAAFGVTYTFEDTLSIRDGSFLGAHTKWCTDLHKWIPSMDVQKFKASLHYAKDLEHFKQRCIGMAPGFIFEDYEWLTSLYTHVAKETWPVRKSNLQDLYFKQE